MDEFLRWRAAIPTPGSPSSRITMQLPLILGSSESTAAVTTLAKPMLVMNRPRFSTCSTGSAPSFHSATRTLPASIPVSTPTNGIGSVSAKAARTCLRCLARLERRGAGDIFVALLRRAAFVNRREAEIARQAARGRAGVHPRQFKRDQRQRQIFRPGDETAVFRVQKRGRDAAFVVMLEQAIFLRRPLVRIASARGHQPRDRPARHAARRLHEHVQFIAVGKAPHDLADHHPAGWSTQVRFSLQE